ncbi:MAG TPA: DUF6789 family protein [Pseudolabrys sp.]|jgi:hypothetical protein
MPPALDRALRSIAAGLCGSAAHTILMTLKDWFGWLPAFRPYDGLQALLASLTGSAVPALVPWMLTYFNGAVVLGLIYGRIHRFLPGGSGVAKGVLFGVLVWCAMGLTFFPAIGMGLFASGAALGFKPALFALAMVLTYSVTLGVAYARLTPDTR